MTLRLINSRPMPPYVPTDGAPLATVASLRRVVRLVIAAFRSSRAAAAERELRRYRYLAHHNEANEHRLPGSAAEKDLPRSEEAFHERPIKPCPPMARRSPRRA